jgi:hypothetical protein
MKGPLIENFYRLFDVLKPQRICEIGTHDGKSAGQMCEYLLQMGLNVDYTGYDLFEEANNETHKIGHNGKGTGRIGVASAKLRTLREKYPGRFNYRLIQGDTTKVLDTPQKYDFAFIDGGHNYEIVKHDYSMLSETPVVVFDDYIIPGVSKAVDEIKNVYQLDTKCKRNKRKQAVRFLDTSIIDKLQQGVLK